MNLGDLRADSRAEIDDNTAQPLVPDADIDRFLNEAVLEVTMRARTLQDSRQPFCTIAVKAGQQRYELDPKILLVRRAKLASKPDNTPLVMTTMSMLDRYYPSWDDPGFTGAPLYGCTNKDYSDHLTLYVAPTPNVNDTLHLTVWRMPLDEEIMVEDCDEVPLPLEMHKDLYLWVAYRCFSRKDSQLEDKDRAARALAIFTDRYGQRPEAHEMKLMGTNRLRGTRPEFF
jgi:hypothetical protein